MNQWSEENFLGRLMPELRRESRARAKSCPDADLLAAYAEDRVSGFVSESVTMHLSQCRQCSEVCARLVNFDVGAFASQDAEWPNAEKRLKNWMDGFLAAKRSVAEPKRVLGAREVPRTGFRWRMSWALGTAAALGVIAGGVIVGGTFVAKRGWRNPTVQVATREPVREPVVQAQNPVVTPAPAPGTQPAAGRQETAKASPAAKTGAEPFPAGTSTTPSPATAARSVDAVRTPPPLERPTTTARSSHLNAGSRFATSAASRPATPSAAAGSAPVVSPNAAPIAAPATTPPATQNSDNSDQIAQQFSPPNLNPNDRIQAGTQGQSSAPGTTTAAHGAKGIGVSLRTDSAAHASPSAAARTAANTTASRAPTAPLPAQLRLEANKRLWIRASLLNQNPDGSFTFTGSLLQPVDQGGVHLDSDTRLEGAGLVKDGAVTISVNSVKYRGVFYFLQAVGDQSGDQKPGAGKALQFHDGQVIEMWFLAPSVYEKAAGDQAKP
jgi:hypothetical protein